MIPLRKPNQRLECPSPRAEAMTKSLSAMNQSHEVHLDTDSALHCSCCPGRTLSMCSQAGPGYNGTKKAAAAALFNSFPYCGWESPWLNTGKPLGSCPNALSSYISRTRNKLHFQLPVVLKCSEPASSGKLLKTTNALTTNPQDSAQAWAAEMAQDSHAQGCWAWLIPCQTETVTFLCIRSWAINPTQSLIPCHCLSSRKPSWTF